MNKLVILPLIFVSSALSAQTNLFPATGNAGVGTTNPSSSLEVSRAANSTLPLGSRDNPAIRLTNTNSSALDEKAELQFSVGGGSVVTASISALYSDWSSPGGSFVGSDLVFATKAATSPLAESLRITRSGDIGIGYRTPQARLHIRTPEVASGIAWGLIVNNPHNAQTSGYGVGIRFQNSVSEWGGNESEKWAGMAAVAGSHWSNQTDLAFYTGDFVASSNTMLSPTERIRIQSGGNVGIGTSTPNAKLDIQGSALAVEAGAKSTLLTLRNSNGNTNQLNVFQLRNSPGADWGTATTRMQQRTDWSDQAYMEFNPPGGLWGMAFGSGESEYMRIANGGNVGIGTSNPTQKLSVNGTVRAREVVVETSGWADYVFEDEYLLKPLSEVEQHIKAHRSLPGMPSANQAADTGVRIGEMQVRLLEKIEELTLHQIRQEKELQALRLENGALKERISALED